MIIDTNPKAWVELQDQITLKEAVSSLLVFINAHISLNNSNKVVVIASHSTTAKFLYPPFPNQTPPQQQSNNRIENGHTMYRQFREINDIVLSQLDLLLEEETHKGHHLNESSSAISGALSLALAYTNRVCDLSYENTKMSSRILLLSVSGDLASQYIPAMNCIFAAQKKRIPIDVCKLGGDTIFLQQACDSTNGIYIKIDHPRALIQYLMGAFTMEPSLRNRLNLGTQKEVDFRAACFITKKIVDIGYVCSVCLCIMSIIPESRKCPMCGTTYDETTLAKLARKPIVVAKKKAKKKKKVEANNDVA